MQQAPHHLPGTDHTQRLNLGSACSSRGAEAASDHRTIATDRTEGRGKHDCGSRTMNLCKGEGRREVCVCIDLHMLVRRHRLSSALLSTAVWVSPNRRGTRLDAFSQSSYIVCNLTINPIHHGAGAGRSGSGCSGCRPRRTWLCVQSGHCGM